MKTYIVATLGGFTQDEHGRDVENLQILEWKIKMPSIEDARAFAFNRWKNNFPSIDEYRVIEIID